MSVYTIECEYFATGEGMTHMIMFTRAYPMPEDYEVEPKIDTSGEVWKLREGKLKYPMEQVALKQFAEKFGGYYAQGATAKEGLHFDSTSAKLLVSPELQAKLVAWEKDAGGFEYHCSLHMNFS